MLYNILFADVNLTADIITEVMETVPADRAVKVWEGLGVPESLVKKISGKLSTAKDKTRACVDLYLCNPGHDPSWRGITSKLYKYGEMAAARKAKSFIDLRDNGEQYHLHIELEEYMYVKKF